MKKIEDEIINALECFKPKFTIDTEPNFKYDNFKEKKISENSRKLELELAYHLEKTLNIPFIGKKKENKNFDNTFISYIEEQPNGSQGRGDLIINYNKKQLTIEIKYNNDNKKPILNGTYPNKDTLYCHYNAKSKEFNYMFPCDENNKKLFLDPEDISQEVKNIAINYNINYATSNIASLTYFVKELYNYLNKYFSLNDRLATLYYRSTFQNKNFEFNKENTNKNIEKTRKLIKEKLQ